MSRVAIRVASRYREARLFAAPPRMVEAVSDWMVATYAGHILAQAENRIAGLVSSENTLDEHARYYADARRKLDAIERDPEKRLPSKKAVTFKLPWPRVSQGKVTFQWRSFGIKHPGFGVKDTEGNQLYLWGDGDKRVSFSKRNWRTLAHILDQHRRMIENYERQTEETRGRLKGTFTPRQETNLVEQHLLRRECLKYTSVAKTYRSKKTRMFPIDLMGWKYIGPNAPVIQSVNESRILYNRMLDLAIKEGEEALEIARKAWEWVRSGEWETMDGEKRQRVLKPLRWDSPFGNAGLGSARFEGPKPSKASKDKFVWIPQFRPWVTKESEYKHGDRWTGTRSGGTFADAEASRQSLLGPDDLIEALEVRWATEIKVTLFFIDHTDRGGQWGGYDRHLSVDVLKHHRKARDVESFQEGVARLRRVVRHELQHFGQDALRYIRQINEDAGLPSRAIRTPGQEPSGYRKEERKRGPHFTRDVEFYTNLADDIDLFVRSLRSIPKPYWSAWFAVWTGARSFGGFERKLLEEYGQTVSGVSAYGAPGSDRIRKLKRYLPDKWRKAVTVALGELHARGLFRGVSSFRQMVQDADRALDE